MKLAVIGLGKLGLPLACLQARHHQVIGIDLNHDAIRSINGGISPIRETGLDELLIEPAVRTNLTAYTDYKKVRDAEFSIVIVPTPSSPGLDGAFTSQYVIDAVTEIGKAVAKQKERHVVVICSTVMPGECEGPITAALERASGKVVGDDIGLIYSPEFIALGSVIADMLNPSVMLIGESDPQSGAAYEKLMRSLTPDTPSRHMSLTSAEIAKISVNAYVTMKISFANVLGELCELSPNANAHVIAEAIGLDSRIGSQYIRPGGPYGGPCFPRDNRAFALAGERVGVSLPLAEASDVINQRQLGRVVKLIEQYPRERVGILGLSYKPSTPVTEEAFGLQLTSHLLGCGYQVFVHDQNLTARDIPPGATWAEEQGRCYGDDRITVIALPDPAYVSSFPQVLSGESRTKSIVLDCWNILPAGPWDNTHIVRLGVSHAS